VPLRVDGRPVAVEGVLTLATANAWWPWPLAVIGVAAATWILGRRRPGSAATIAVCAAGVACAIAVAVATAEHLSLPAEAGRRLVPILVPAVGAVAALAASVVPPLRRRPSAGRNLGLLAAAAAASWAALRLTVLTRPVLVTDLSPDLDRAGTAVALGLALAAAALLVAPARQGEPDPTDAADDPDTATVDVTGAQPTPATG
jgi:hypothetical protein